jgi:hypothetical protein
MLLKKLKIITQPGAEFPATSGGATHYYQQKTRKLFEVLHIPSSSFTSYDDVR